MQSIDLVQCSTCTCSKATKGTRDLFLKAVSIWINKPHVVNRRLCGSKIIKVVRCQKKEDVDKEIGEIKELTYHGTMEYPSADDMFKDMSDEQEPFTVLVRELIPKSEHFPKLYEVIVYDKENGSVSFMPMGQIQKLPSTNEISYCFRFQSLDGDFPSWAQVNEIFLWWSCNCKESEKARCQVSSDWLSHVLLGKLVNWSQVNDISTSATSLLLVPVDKYKETYVRLKNNYGRDLVKNWTESTDPEKFVYEDVAIATYLLLIWEEDRKRKGLTQKQSFVDLGCGNGLLVYILTREGHKGLGIDLRKRKIWDTFGPGINLKEEAVSPSSENLFPEYDWLIGNHSDELTPWIPVIAARSSYNTCFFVLPCCHFDFVGKFTDIKKGQSRYGIYVDYVQKIVGQCGFKTEVDTLRIPSTKRICIIGRERTYKQEEETTADVKRQLFIDKRTKFARFDPIFEKKKSAQSSNSTNKQCSDQSLSDSPVSREPIEKIENISTERTQTSTNSNPDSSSISKSEDTKLKSNHNSDVSSNNVDNASESSDTDSPDKKKAKYSTPDGSTATPGTENESSLTDFHKSDDQKSISTSQGGGVGGGDLKDWVRGFEPRKEVAARNCQSVPYDTKMKIVMSVFELILEAEGGETVEVADGRAWRKGGAVGLSQVAAMFGQVTLQQLKSECGGLQTLLRNFSHVFQVTGGHVMLRDFSVADPWKGCNPQKKKKKGNKEKSLQQQKDAYKTKLCWFYKHHPDGCPRDLSACQFAHGAEDLRNTFNMPSKRT